MSMTTPWNIEMRPAWIDNLIAWICIKRPKDKISRISDTQ